MSDASACRVPMSLPRQVIPGSFYKITRRCTQRQFLMRPDAATNNAWVYCVAVAAQRYGVVVINTTAMSNHHHTDVYDPRGTINEFVELLHQLFAKSQNVLRGRSENFWSSETPGIERLEDTEAVINAIVYTAINPVKDWLVERVADWPGISGVGALLDGRAIRATRPEHFFRRGGPMPDQVTLELVIPPELGDSDTIRELLRERVAAEEKRLAELRRELGRKVLGRHAVLAQPWSAAPTSEGAREGRNPRFAASNPLARIDARERARGFVQAYRAARARWIAGLHAIFPAGTYWLRRFAGVTVAALPS